MTLSELLHRLLSDLRALKLPVDDVDVFFRPYSKSYYGRYYPATKKLRARMFIYPLANTRGDLLDYDTVLTTAIHEFCHHIQYSSGFTRVKGVMHNEQFWQLYNRYTSKAQELRCVS